MNAQDFDTFDRCPRRFAFEREYEPSTISALGLLYAAVEGSMTAVDPIQGAKDAIMERTARLDISAGELSPISVVRHVEATAEVIALALREKLGRAKRVEDVALGNYSWQSNLFDCKGLHRIVLASHMDDDTLRSFAHSWGTIGELAALERPITLTIVLVGAQRGGRRHSHWSKGFQHPVQRSALRFAARSKDDGFTKGWKQIWREQTDIKAETWLNRMESDEVLSDLIVSRKIQYNAEDARMIQARKDMLTITESMQEASTEAPMRRSSCDELGRGPCPWQSVCYSPQTVSPAEMPHLFRARETPLVELEAEK